jgi:hypothetical protein
LLDSIDNRLNRRGIGIDPWLLPQFKDRSEIIGTMAGMSTYSPVVMNGDLLSGIIVPFIRYPVLELLITEAIFSMRPVAKWFVIRAAATAQGDSGYSTTGVTVGVPDVGDDPGRRVIQQIIGSIGQAGDFGIIRFHDSTSIAISTK